MSEVYAVSVGSYSDYSVLAIFTTREKAEAYAAELLAEREDVNEIEEYRLDAPREELPGAWTILIDDTGQPHPHVPGSFQVSYVASRPAEVHSEFSSGPRWFSGYGRTLEHARRSAEELRRQTLALEGKVISGGPP